MFKATHLRSQLSSSRGWRIIKCERYCTSGPKEIEEVTTATRKQATGLCTTAKKKNTSGGLTTTTVVVVEDGDVGRLRPRICGICSLSAEIAAAVNRAMRMGTMIEMKRLLGSFCASSWVYKLLGSADRAMNRSLGMNDMGSGEDDSSTEKTLWHTMRLRGEHGEVGEILLDEGEGEGMAMGMGMVMVTDIHIGEMMMILVMVGGRLIVPSVHVCTASASGREQEVVLLKDKCSAS